MSWNPVRRLSEIPSRARLINAGGWRVFRDTRSLRAFGPDASAPAWLFEDPACGPWGCQRTVFAEGLVVSVGAELWRASSVRASSSPRVAGDAVALD